MIANVQSPKRYQPCREGVPNSIDGLIDESGFWGELRRLMDKDRDNLLVLTSCRPPRL